MNKLRIEYLQDRLVKLTTIEGFEIIDYYEFDPRTGTLLLESQDVDIHINDILKIEEVDSTFDDILDEGILVKSKSKYEH